MPSLFEETFLGWNGGSGRKFYLDPLYDYLVYIDPLTGNLVPGIASSWATSTDGKSVQLFLRKGIQFHQGWGELTSEDVVFSIQETMSPSSRAGPASALREMVESVEAVDAYSVSIILKKPDIDFVRGYLTNGQQVPIISKCYIESVGEQEANKAPIGSGSFILESYHSNRSITLRSVHSHWRVSNPVEQLVFLSVPNEATRVAMLKAGEIDIAPISFDSMAGLKKQGFHILSMEKNWAPVIRFGGVVKTNSRLLNPNVPWAHKKVRQALNYAIDKDVIVNAIFHGEAVAAGMDFPANEWQAISAYPYNPGKAKQLLKEAGFENGFTLTLNTFESSPGADLPLVAEVVGQYWQAIGVQARVVPIDWSSLRGAIVNGNATDVLWTHRGLMFSNPAVGLQMSSSGKSLFATYSDEDTERMLLEISQSLDISTRETLLKQLASYLHEQAAAVYIAYANEPFAVSSRVKNWPRIRDHLTNFDSIQMTTKE